MNNNNNILTIDKYMIFLNERIGKGMFGEVFKGSYLPGHALDEKNSFLAVKLIELPSYGSDKIADELESIKQEIRILRCLKHPNIVRLHDVKRLDRKIWIFMEFCNQGDLKTFIMNNDLAEDEIFYYFNQILNGFKCIRKKNIVHRDIKPENILLNNHIVKIADFGFAKKVNSIGQQYSSLKGTPVTMAPQILEGDLCTDKVDIYSLGATLYFMLFKTFPYNADNLIHLVNRIKSGELPSFTNSKGTTVSKEVKELLLSMLKYEEKDRIDWEDLFKHPKLQLTQNRGLEGLNIIGVGGDDALLEQIEEEYPDLEFDFSPKAKMGLDQKKIEEVGQKIIDEWNLKQRMDEITFRFNSRITFERGIAWFVRKVFKRYEDFCNKKNQMNLEAIPFELLNMLKFCLSKYELIILQNLKENLENRDNICKFDSQDWSNFVQTPEFERLLKYLKLDFQTFSIQVLHIYTEYIEPLRTVSIKSYNPETTKIFNSSIFDKDLLNLDIEEFNNSFTNLILAVLIHFKKTKIEKIKVNDYGTYANQEYKDIIFLIDDFLILLSYRNIFIWDEKKPINFNKFFQDRLSYFENNESFNIIKDRVLLTYEHLI